MSRHSEGLLGIYPKGKVELSHADAKRLGIASGDLVEVSSRRGQVVAEAEVTDKNEAGLIFMTFHFPDAAANLLTVRALDPVGKIPEYKVAAVKIRRIEQPAPVA